MMMNGRGCLYSCIHHIVQLLHIILCPTDVKHDPVISIIILVFLVNHTGDIPSSTNILNYLVVEVDRNVVIWS